MKKISAAYRSVAPAPALPTTIGATSGIAHTATVRPTAKRDCARTGQSPRRYATRARPRNCTQRAFLDAHHIQHWLDGGPTKKDNLALTCHPHHVCVHEGGFSAQRNDDGSLTFFEPDGTPIADSLPPPDIAGSAENILRDDADARGLHIDHDTNLVQHNGHGLDLHAAVDTLLPLDFKLGRSVPSHSA